MFFYINIRNTFFASAMMFLNPEAIFFKISKTTLSVQNLACIKFGDWQISDFWRGFNLAIQNIG